MRIAIWGAGYGVYNAIDGIDNSMHTICYLIDSNQKLRGEKRNGIVVCHFSDVSIDMVDCIINTTSHFDEVKETVLKNWDGFPSEMLFSDIRHFLAYEYAYITHKELQENPIFQILSRKKFQLNTDKRLQYLETYHRYFGRFRNRNCVFCEIGVFHGDSLRMWKEYFGKQCKIIGIDINRECLQYADEQVEIEIGSQSSSSFWEYIRNTYGLIDMILDDGGHTMNQQITTWLEMFPSLNYGGVYMCEDVHTSFWDKYAAGKEKSFLDFSTEIAMEMEMAGWQTEDTWHRRIARDVTAIHFHEQSVVFEKGKTYPMLGNNLLK